MWNKLLACKLGLQISKCRTGEALKSVKAGVCLGETGDQEQAGICMTAAIGCYSKMNGVEEYGHMAHRQHA